MALGAPLALALPLALPLALGALRSLQGEQLALTLPLALGMALRAPQGEPLALTLPLALGMALRSPQGEPLPLARGRTRSASQSRDSPARGLLGRAAPSHRLVGGRGGRGGGEVVAADGRFSGRQ